MSLPRSAAFVPLLVVASLPPAAVGEEPVEHGTASTIITTTPDAADPTGEDRERTLRIIVGDGTVRISGARGGDGAASMRLPYRGRLEIRDDDGLRIFLEDERVNESGTDTPASPGSWRILGGPTTGSPEDFDLPSAERVHVTAFDLPDFSGSDYRLSHVLGRRAVLGITLDTVAPSLAAHLDVDPGSVILVGQVQPGLPADRCGIRPFDVITHINGSTPATPDRLRRVLADKDDGDVITLRIVRNGGCCRDIDVELDAVGPEMPGPRQLFNLAPGTRFETSGIDEMRTWTFGADSGLEWNLGETQRLAFDLDELDFSGLDVNEEGVSYLMLDSIEGLPGVTRDVLRPDRRAKSDNESDAAEGTASDGARRFIIEAPPNVETRALRQYRVQLDEALDNRQDGKDLVELEMLIDGLVGPQVRAAEPGSGSGRHDVFGDGTSRLESTADSGPDLADRVDAIDRRLARIESLLERLVAERERLERR